MKRVGVGAGDAFKIIAGAAIKAGDPKDVPRKCLEAVISEYKKVFGQGWEKDIETQANLLFMVREMMTDDIFKRWTYDGRDEYFDLKSGVILNDEEYKASSR